MASDTWRPHSSQPGFTVNPQSPKECKHQAASSGGLMHILTL
jgi:hypothetical protein